MEEQQYLRVGGRIRHDILSGAFSFGQRLKIDELAARYGTSHMPIREALKMLAGEGLVDMMPNRGVRVRIIDARFVSNLFDVRIAMEKLQARLTAARRTDDDISALTEARLEFEKCATKRDVPALLAANQRFHQVISIASGNPEAASVEARHWRILPAIWTTKGYPVERLGIVIDDHRLLEHLIRDRDAEGSAILAAAHCLRAKLHMLEAMNLSS